MHMNILRETYEALDWETTRLSNMNIFRALVVTNIKQDTLDVKVVKCLFIAYSKSVNSDKLWNVEYEGSN